MDAIANIMNLFIFVFCILFVNIDKTVVCASVKSIKSLSLSLSLKLLIKAYVTRPSCRCRGVKILPMSSELFSY